MRSFRNRLFILTLMFALTNWVSAQTEEMITVTDSSGNLYGQLLLPSNFQSGPVVLIIPGSGPTDGDGNQPGLRNNSLLMIAQGLAKSGIASLRYDKRGVGKSRQAMVREEDLRFQTYVDDAIKWIRKLAHDDRFTNLVIAGHSQGSLIGILAAKGTGAHAFISLAGPGSNAADLIREQLASHSADALQAAEPILELIENGKRVEAVPLGLYSLFRPGVQAFLASWFVHDPAEAIGELDIPVLIIQGTTDLQVAVRQGQLLAEANPNAELLVLENMNHVLKEAPAERSENLKTYSNELLPLHPELLPAMVSFINNLD